MKSLFNLLNTFSFPSLTKTVIPIVLLISLSHCGKRAPIEEKNDPLLQLLVINVFNEYYTNSCKFPSLILKKGEVYPLNLSLYEKKWFRFSPEGTTPNPASNYSFFIDKTAGTEVELYTSNSCEPSPGYTYDRAPFTITSTELKYQLWNSDFRNQTTNENGYYIKFISGNPNVRIRFQ